MKKKKKKKMMMMMEMDEQHQSDFEDGHVSSISLRPESASSRPSSRRPASALLTRTSTSDWYSSSSMDASSFAPTATDFAVHATPVHRQRPQRGFENTSEEC